MKKNVIKYHEAGQLINKVDRAILENDLETVKQILINNCYEHLTQQEKEQTLFYSIYSQSFASDNAAPFLKYIIFDYKISEGNSITNIPELSEKIRNMFENRKLNEALSNELHSNEQTSKRLKV